MAQDKTNVYKVLEFWAFEDNVRIENSKMVWILLLLIPFDDLKFQTSFKEIFFIFSTIYFDSIII